MKIVIIGPQGSGKGTQAKILSSKLGIPHISTGDILREEIKGGTELGNKVKTLIEKGELVSDEIIFEILRKRISKPDCKNGFIFDGVPRTMEQAKMLEGIGIDKVIYLDIPDDISVKRISSRYQCKNCGTIYGHDVRPKVIGRCDHCNAELYQRDDDKPEAVKKRLEIFHKETEPIIRLYKQKGILIRIDGSQTIQDVARAIEQEVMKCSG